MSGTSVKSSIGNSDINFATGGTGAAETFTRRTSTGGSLTLDKIDASHLKYRTAVNGAAASVENSVTAVYVADSYGTTQDKTTIDAAVTAIGSDKAILKFLPGTWDIDADLSLPANINLWPEYGAILQVATTKTLTIAGAVIAGRYQIFSCSGTGKLTWNSTTKPDVAWWGVNRNGATTDTAAFQAAVTAVDGGNTKPKISVGGGSYALATAVQFYEEVAFDCDKGVTFVPTGAYSAFTSAEALWTTGGRLYDLLTDCTIDASANANNITLIQFDHVCNKRGIKRVKFYGNNSATQNGLYLAAHNSNDNRIQDNYFQGLQNGYGIKLGDKTAGTQCNQNHINKNYFSGSGFTNAVIWYGQANHITGNNLGSSYQPIAFNSTTGYAEGGLNVPFYGEDASFENDVADNYFDNGGTKVLIRAGLATSSAICRMAGRGNTGLNYTGQIMDYAANVSDSCAKGAATTLVITGVDRTTRYRPNTLVWIDAGSADPVNDGWWSGLVTDAAYAAGDTTLTLDITVPDNAATVYPSGQNNNPAYLRILNISKYEQYLPNLKAGLARFGITGSTFKVIKTGDFTCDAAADTTVTDVAATTNSRIFLTPTNAAARTLQRGATRLEFKSTTAGSFTVTTDGAAAAGTETFDYLMVDIGS